VVFTYLDARLFQAQSDSFRELQQRVAAMGEPFLSGFNPAELAANLATCGLVFTLVRASPHAAELLTYTHSMAGEIFANLDLEMLDMFRAAMANDPELAGNAEQLARALYFGSAPLASRSETTAQMEQEVGV